MYQCLKIIDQLSSSLRVSSCGLIRVEYPLLMVKCSLTTDTKYPGFSLHGDMGGLLPGSQKFAYSATKKISGSRVLPLNFHFLPTKD